MKKILLSLLVVLVLVSGCSLSGSKNNDDKKEEEQEQIISSFGDETIDGISISGFNMLYQNSQTSIAAKVKNTTNSDVKIKRIEFTLYDENDKQMMTEPGFFYLDVTLAPGEERSVSHLVSGNVVAAKKITYEIIK